MTKYIYESKLSPLPFLMFVLRVGLVLSCFLFASFPMLSLKFSPIDEKTGKPIKGYIASISRLGLDKNKLNKAKKDIQISSFILGRSEITYTRYLPYGPDAGSFYIKGQEPLHIPRLADVPGLKSRIYALHFHKPGYESKIIRFSRADLSSDKALNVPIRPKITSVELLVVDQDGVAVKNAHVFMRNYYHTQEGFTDNNGIWSHPHVFSGKYRIAILGPKNYGQIVY